MSKLDEINKLLSGAEKSLRALEHADLALGAIIPEPEDTEVESIEENELEDILKELSILEVLKNDKG